MLTLPVTLALFAGPAKAGATRIAVASNFAAPMRVVVEHFESKTANEVTLVFGSTGKHDTQIRNGAPFDAFLAADVEHPEQLERDGMALPGSRFTYAVGKVVLWSPSNGYVDSEGSVLERGGFRHLAIANPMLAPYGRAAEEVLQARGVWDALGSHIVFGENIAQAFQFVKSGNADLGFVAYSQVKRPDGSVDGSLWEVPQTLYSPIEQQAVLLTNNDVARDLLAFVRSDEARAIIRGFGYETP